MNEIKPSGWFATCKCNQQVAAVDANLATEDLVLQLIGAWTVRGDKVRPFYASSIKLSACRCTRKELAE